MTKDFVLFIDDEDHLRRASKQSLDLAGFEVQAMAQAERALDHIHHDFKGIVISDIKMPGMDGMTLLQKIMEIDGDLPVILITGHGDVPLAVEAIRMGAYDFLQKPFAASQLIDLAKKASEKRRLTLENRQLKASLAGESELEAQLLGRSPIMTETRRQIEAIAGADADVLILGETGTGKNVAARLLHQLSGRKNHAFVTINCAALPAELIESELFGHEAGAHAGALRARYGKFEHGKGGTIFLDDVDSMPLELQVKLLDVLETRQITRLGSNDPVDLDVRFLAASSRPLDRLVREGRFRADLYYRLNVIRLTMPPLRDHKQDLALLFHHFSVKAAQKFGREAKPIPTEILSGLAAKDWHGNARELRNAAERFTLGLEALEKESFAEQARTLAEQMADFERNAIIAALTAHEGKLKDCYEALGLSRKALYEKMQKYGLRREDYNAEDDDESLVA